MTYWLKFLGAAGADARWKAVVRYDADGAVTARVKLAWTFFLCSIHGVTLHTSTVRLDSFNPVVHKKLHGRHIPNVGIGVRVGVGAVEFQLHGD